MTTALGSPARVGPGRDFAPAIARPGDNCWCVERADRFHCVQDAADYYRWVRHAVLQARHTVFVVGWDIQASLDLLPGADPPVSNPPTRLDELLAFVVRRRPQLRCYVLIWDHAALYTLERDPFSRWRLGWRMPRQVRFGFDDHHPVGASHHQKIVVVDDAVAFCGGTDLTGHRWDTCAHRVDEPARMTATGKAYGPYHEVQAMMSGPAAARLGVLVRDRWRAVGEEPRPLLAGAAADDLWPADVEPDLVDADVAIARTLPGSERGQGVRECERLFLDSIAAARHAIYIESQYFTNDVLSAALAERLRDRDGSGSRGGRAQGVPRMARAQDHGRAARRGASATGRRGSRRPAASRVSSGVPGRRRPDVRALEGDDRRRRAGPNRLGELLATVDGRRHRVRRRG